MDLVTATATPRPGLSAESGHVDVVKVLVEAGANVDQGDKDDGATPLSTLGSLGLLSPFTSHKVALTIRHAPSAPSHGGGQRPPGGGARSIGGGR